MSGTVCRRYPRTDGQRKLGGLFAECDRDSVYPERFVKALADRVSTVCCSLKSTVVWTRGLLSRRRVDGAGTSGGTNLCAVPLPGGFNTFLREGTQEQIDKIWLSAAPVSRCGTQRLPNRAGLRRG